MRSSDARIMAITEELLADLNQRLGHLEKYYGEANHDLHQRLADLERRNRMLASALLEVASHLPAEVRESEDSSLKAALETVRAEVAAFEVK